jgi:hypothetical protein
VFKVVGSCVDVETVSSVCGLFSQLIIQGCQPDGHIAE